MYRLGIGVAQSDNLALDISLEQRIEIFYQLKRHYPNTIYWGSQIDRSYDEESVDYIRKLARQGTQHFNMKLEMLLLKVRMA